MSPKTPRRVDLMVRALFLTAVIAAPVAVLPVLAESSGSCPNTCPDGQVRSLETGKCVPYEPLMMV